MHTYFFVANIMIADKIVWIWATPCALWIYASISLVITEASSYVVIIEEDFMAMIDK